MTNKHYKMTNKERAELLYHKYTKEYNRFVVSGYIKQGYPEWIEIGKELKQLYK
jgi:hypothetical protein